MLGRENFGLHTDPYATIRQLIRLPAHRRKTFVYDTPSDTHYRKATCAEVECSKYANGFAIPITPSQDIEAFEGTLKQAGYTFARGEGPEHLAAEYPAGTRWLVFPPEQRCLESFKNPHRIALDHDPIVSIRGGDFRMFTGDNQHFNRVDDWVDALQESTQRLHEEIEKG